MHRRCKKYKQVENMKHFAYQAEEHRQKENQAAIRIQSWFRACRVRACLIHLRKKAVIIQKIWRGFRARARFRQMIYRLCYDRFFVRKYIHNFYVRKRYLEGISRKNEFIRRELDELAVLQKRERDCLQMVEEQTAKFYQAHRLHYLLSTKLNGQWVFNSPFRPAPHEMEQLLRQVKYQAPTRLTHRGRACLLGRPEPPAPSFSGSLGAPLVETTRICSFSRPLLPPIANKQKQVST
uniref:Spermatogenesis associated 17 n=1 Tax=Mola mola TaxID=94237 RepID=A0A3Q3VXS1_MOLML